VSDLADLAAAVIADADRRGVYMTPAIATQIVRLAPARFHAAFGSPETRAARLASANAYLAPHGWRIRDLDAEFDALEATP